MAVLDEIKASLLADTNKEKTETPTDAPASTEGSVAATKDVTEEPVAAGTDVNPIEKDSVETKPVAETANAEPATETKPVEENPKPETTEPAKKPTYTDKEKAEYAFKKRLDRQAKQYKDEIDKLRKEVESLKNPTKPLTRDQFKTDEEFVKANFNALIDEKLNKQKEEFEAKSKKEQELRENQENFSKLVLNDFGNFEDFNNAVEPALSDGLGELINTNPTVNDYITKNPNGAKMLYELATNRNACEKVFTAQTLWDQYYALKRIEEGFEGKSFKKSNDSTPTPTPAPVPEVKPTVTPIIGKVGSGSKGPQSFNFDDNNWLRSVVRQR